MKLNRRIAATAVAFAISASGIITPAVAQTVTCTVSEEQALAALTSQTGKTIEELAALWAAGEIKILTPVTETTTSATISISGVEYTITVTPSCTTAPTTSTVTETVTPAPGSSLTDKDSELAGAAGLAALALGAVALSSGGSSEGSSQKSEEKKPEAPKTTEAGAPQKSIDSDAPQKGIDPAKAPKSEKAPAKGEKNRGMLASTGATYPATLGAIAVLLTIAAGAIFAARRQA